MSKPFATFWKTALLFCFISNAAFAKAGPLSGPLICSFGLQDAGGFGVGEHAFMLPETGIDPETADMTIGGLLILPGMRFGKEGLYIYNNQAAYFKEIDHDASQFAARLAKQDSELRKTKMKVHDLKILYKKNYGKIDVQNCDSLTKFFSKSEQKDDCIALKSAMDSLNKLEDAQLSTGKPYVRYKVTLEGVPFQHLHVRYSFHRNLTPIIEAESFFNQEWESDKKGISAKPLVITSKDLIQDENKNHLTKLYGHILHQMSEVDIAKVASSKDTLDWIKHCTSVGDVTIAEKARLILCQAKVPGYSSCLTESTSGPQLQKPAKKDETKTLK